MNEGGLMRVKNVVLAGILASVGFAALAAESLSGTWAGDWGPSASDRNNVTVELKFDGKSKVTGTVNPGPNAVDLKNGTFDEKTGALHLEADAKGRRGNDIHYVIDGKLEKDALSGSW